MRNVGEVRIEKLFVHSFLRQFLWTIVPGDRTDSAAFLSVVLPPVECMVLFVSLVDRAAGKGECQTVSEQ